MPAGRLPDLIRKIETLTGQPVPRHVSPLLHADAIVAHIEINRQHGVGVLLERWFGAAANILSIRSADQFGGRQEFGAAAIRVSHLRTSPDEVRSRVLNAVGGHRVARILCVPYYPDDARNAIALAGISGAPMCTFLMDDSGIEDELMRALLEKSALRLAISRQIQETYQNKFGVPIAYMPPLAPARWIATQIEIPVSTGPRGAMVGNIWGARWLELLRETVRASGVEIDWYSHAAFPGDREGLLACGIHPREPHPDEALVRALRAHRFAVLPSGTLDARDDRDFIARRSLPSRLIYMMATSLIPVIVLGSAETAAARFVERHAVGLRAAYGTDSFRAAVEEILKPEVQRRMRERSLDIASSYADTGAAEWIWRSLENGGPVDRRFENL